MGRLAFLITVLVLIPTITSADIWYVKPDSTGRAINIQAAIDSCTDGDTVLVSPGIFRGDGNRDIDFRGKPILVISECRYNSTVTDSSIIDCEGSRDEYHRGFYFHSGETNSSILDGFLILNGYYKEGSIGGGAVFCDSASSPVIRFNLIAHCTSDFHSWGGGIFCRDASNPKIEYNRIAYCYSMLGTGIASCNASPIIRGNQFTNNTNEWMSSGIIYCVSSSPLIHENEILKTVPPRGGSANVYAICCDSCTSASIIENNIHDNFAGGVQCSYSDAVIENNYILNNRFYADMTCYAYGISGYSSSLTICNNTIEGSRYSAIIAMSQTAAIVEDNTIIKSKCGGQFGGAFICFDGIGYSTIRNNIIRQDTIAIFRLLRSNSHCAYEYAVINYTGDSTVTIANNIIEDITGSNYACIRCYSSATITQNVIANNYGGVGVELYGGYPLVTNNLILNNYNHLSSREGGGIFNYSSFPTIANNTIVGNTARNGTGVYCTGGIIRNNIICDNMMIAGETDLGGGIYVTNNDVIIECNDVFNNAGGNYVGVPDQTGMNGNISVDPLFCSPEMEEYTLHHRSMCLPGNHPDGADCGLMGAFGEGCEVATLLQGFSISIKESAVSITWTMAEVDPYAIFFMSRSIGNSDQFIELNTADIYINDLTYTYLDANCEPGLTYRYRIGIEDFEGRRILFETDPVATPGYPLSLYQNVPNPFNPSTMIRYYLPEKTKTQLSIFDVSGKRIINLIDELQEKGFHAVGWNGRDQNSNPVASGVYFYRLKAGKKTISKKMILTR